MLLESGMKRSVPGNPGVIGSARKAGRKSIGLRESGKMREKDLVKQELVNRIRPGRANATTALNLAIALGYKNDRMVRACIDELIKEDGYPIASATQKPAGYFLAVTQDEVDIYARSLRGRVINDAIRRRNFLRAAKAIKFPGQMPLHFING